MPLTSPIGDDPEGVNQETVSSSSGSGENEEHLQLSLEEAFFLVFAVECIAVSEQKTSSTCDQLLGGDPAGNAGFDLLKRQLSQASHLLQRQFQCKCQCRTPRQTIHLSFGMQHIITTGAWAGWSRMV
ncbi:hypothetical protein BGZ88_008343 [Linnemannia elongata]|nr:hypothetical protein BGZ88_008343 [Linnemannia elongata]